MLGAVSVATACAVPGTVAHALATGTVQRGLADLDVEHPTGFFTVQMEVDGGSGGRRSAPLGAAAHGAQADGRAASTCPPSAWEGA